MTEIRVPIERVDGEGTVTGRGTARMRGVTLDDYQTPSGGDLPLRAGESYVLVVTLAVEESDA